MNDVKTLFCGLKPVILLVSLFFVSQVNAIIVQPGSGRISSKPSNLVLGRWNGSASCVAIAPGYVITTTHQGGGVNSNINIGGANYKASKVYRKSGVDFMVVKLSGASLTDYVDISDSKSIRNKETVIGGFGNAAAGEVKGRGYKWDGSANTTLRWCTNKIDSVNSSYLIADFDILGSGATICEGAIANRDSGGGWFVKNGGEWELAGLSSRVAKAGITEFGSRMGAVNLNKHADWISQIIGRGEIIPPKEIVPEAPLVIPEPVTVVLMTVGLVFIRKRKMQS